MFLDEDYRGVHALTKVANNKIILEVPLSHIMTSGKHYILIQIIQCLFG
jgi:hypothetical protein